MPGSSVITSHTLIDDVLQRYSDSNYPRAIPHVQCGSTQRIPVGLRSPLRTMSSNPSR